jgi:membrane-bound lytic murein transglycosylase MltF
MLQAKDPLDPDLVKALVATESSFNADAKVRAGKKAGWARGLMQVTDATLRTLKDEDGELRDHLVNINQTDMTDPNANLAAGIRWLFRKKETASSKLGREATWEEAIADYKSYLKDMKKGKTPRSIRDLREFYGRLKSECEDSDG